MWERVVNRNNRCAIYRLCVILRIVVDEPEGDEVEVVEDDSIQLTKERMGREIWKYHHHPFQQ